MILVSSFKRAALPFTAPGRVMLFRNSLVQTNVNFRSKFGTLVTVSTTKAIQRRPINAIVHVRALSSFNNRGNQNDDGNNKKLGMIASAGMALSVLAGKTKYLFVALKLTKFAPAASMVLSSFAYSFFFGWPYAVGMVGLIFFHELGHALVMKRYGVPFSPMVFIPFMGAVIAMKDNPKNAYEDAMIAFGGPALGSVAALGMGTLGSLNDSQLMLALADFGYMVNLFNLMPIGSMDGGRIAGAIHPYIGVVGLLGGGALIATGEVHNPLFYIIMLSGTYSTVSRIFGWDENDNKNYYRIPRAQQGVILTAYVGLIAALILAMRENNKNRKTPKQLEREKQFGGPLPWNIDGFKQQDGVYDDYFK